MAPQPRSPGFRIEDVLPLPDPASEGLPPGQRAIPTFPRFGAHFAKPIPSPPLSVEVQIGGETARTLALSVERIRAVGRKEVVADFHCVAGWSARGLRWAGVPFRALYDAIIAPEARPAVGARYLDVMGLDGYHAVLTLDDALDESVLLADELDGRPLSGEHGGPLRLLSPKQYGYVNAKHLCRIDFRSERPAFHHEHRLERFLLSLVTPHERARVAFEERHRFLPAWLVRPMYRRLIPRFAILARAGMRRP